MLIAVLNHVRSPAADRPTMTFTSTNGKDDSPAVPAPYSINVNRQNVRISLTGILTDSENATTSFGKFALLLCGLGTNRCSINLVRCNGRQKVCPAAIELRRIDRVPLSAEDCVLRQPRFHARRLLYQQKGRW